MKATLLLAALAATAQAFKDTSPFLIVSSSPLPKLDSSTGGLGLSAEILSSTKSLLSPCTSELYLIVSQPSLSIHDISFSPFLRSMVTAKQSGNAGVVMREVLGFNGAEGMDLVRFLGNKCSAPFSQTIEGKGKRVVLKEFAALEGRGESREEMLRDNDAVLQKTLSQIPKETSYTLIFLSTSPPSSHPASPSTSEDEPLYSPSFSADTVHMDLKRELPYPRGNGTLSDLRPLFEKYQFLTPGLFMGLLVGLVLIAILSVGISAISGLSVSYGAFEKEMGPGAQKKAQ